MINLTENEINLIKSFAVSEYNCTNGDPVTSETTREELATFVFLEMHEKATSLNVRQLKGVLSSLIKKELVNVYECKPDPDEINFTELGLQTVKELYGI